MPRTPQNQPSSHWVTEDKSLTSLNLLFFTYEKGVVLGGRHATLMHGQQRHNCKGESLRMSERLVVGLCASRDLLEAYRLACSLCPQRMGLQLALCHPEVGLAVGTWRVLSQTDISKTPKLKESLKYPSQPPPTRNR